MHTSAGRLHTNGYTAQNKNHRHHTPGLWLCHQRNPPHSRHTTGYTFGQIYHGKEKAKSNKQIYKVLHILMGPGDPTKRWCNNV